MKDLPLRSPEERVYFLLDSLADRAFQHRKLKQANGRHTRWPVQAEKGARNGRKAPYGGYIVLVRGKRCGEPGAIRGADGTEPDRIAVGMVKVLPIAGDGRGHHGHIEPIQERGWVKGWRVLGKIAVNVRTHWAGIQQFVLYEFQLGA